MTAKISKPAKTHVQGPTLRHVIDSAEAHRSLTPTRRRDLRSAVMRVAALLNEPPERIPLDLASLGAQLGAVNPAAAGLKAKRFANIRSDFMAAVRASGLKPVQRTITPLSPVWKKLRAELAANKRAFIGLSRLARYASAHNIKPSEVGDATIAAFITAVRVGTLHRKPNDLHRVVATVWNEVAQDRHGLKPVTVPSFRRPPQRLEWTRLPRSFRDDVETFKSWCGGADVFAEDARSRHLAPNTIKQVENQIHAAVTALVDSGVKPVSIKSLADLVVPENFKRILRRRYAMVDGCVNVFNHDLARALVQLARRWVKVDAVVLAELVRLAGKVPLPALAFTEKNKRALRQFDDPEMLQRLFNFPQRLWADVKRNPRPNRQTLVKAQAAIAVGILCYMPLRLENLASLAFDEHIFLREGPSAISSLELPAGEVKNRIEMAFDIPPQVAKILFEYRNRIAPQIIGHRPTRLFVNADGSPKTKWTVAWTIRTRLRRAGLVLSSHQFRHVCAKVLLDAEPGAFETVRQLLGHRSLQTTVDAYAGIDSRRAARHHHRLVEKALAGAEPVRRSNRFG
jgi:integrase